MFRLKNLFFHLNDFLSDTLGPEMRSTGEVMGIASTVGNAYLKSQMAAGQLILKQVLYL